MPNAQATTLIVCLVSRQYLESEACATEFRVAWNLGKLMVVCLDPPDIGSFKRAMLATDTKATPTASGPFMYVAGGGQLTARLRGRGTAVIQERNCPMRSKGAHDEWERLLC